MASERAGTRTVPLPQGRPPRPTTGRDFAIAIFCALVLEADAVLALFDHHWDDGGPPYDPVPGDPNTYSTGAIGLHNVVLVHMPGMGKIAATAAAARCGFSFPNIKLAVVVGVCGAVPFTTGGEEIVLGDVIISEGVVQYDLGRRMPEGFLRKNTPQDSLGRPSAEVRSRLAGLKGIHSQEKHQDKMAGYLAALQTRAKLECRAEATPEVEIQGLQVT